MVQVSLFSTKATGLPPELVLQRGKKWHIFLSHCWASGQDQCAVIKRRLQLQLPGCACFLDVDDLSEIGALETYVQRPVEMRPRPVLAAPSRAHMPLPLA